MHFEHNIWAFILGCWASNILKQRPLFLQNFNLWESALLAFLTTDCSIFYSTTFLIDSASAADFRLWNSKEIFTITIMHKLTYFLNNYSMAKQLSHNYPGELPFAIFCRHPLLPQLYLAFHDHLPYHYRPPQSTLLRQRPCCWSQWNKS